MDALGSIEAGRSNAIESDYFRHMDGGAVMVVELTPSYNTPWVTTPEVVWCEANDESPRLGKDCLVYTTLRLVGTIRACTFVGFGFVFN